MLLIQAGIGYNSCLVGFLIFPEELITIKNGAQN